MVLFRRPAEGGQVIADQETARAGEKDPALQVTQDFLAPAGNLDLPDRKNEPLNGDN